MRAMQTLQLNSGKLRYEVREGRRFWVAPLTMIVPGVLNGSQGALYYPPDEISKTHRAWHGVPVTVNHPDKNGIPCSIMEEGIWDQFGIGLVQFPTVNDEGKLLAEAWIDEALCRSRRPDILQNLKAGRTIELSTGLFTDNHPSKGDHNGKPYTHIARNYRPDHLAILPDTPGACSVKDGCGVLVNELVVPVTPLFNCDWVTTKTGTRLCIGDGGKVEKGPKAVKDALNKGKGKGKSDEETEDYEDGNKTDDKFKEAESRYKAGRDDQDRADKAKAKQDYDELKKDQADYKSKYGDGGSIDSELKKLKASYGKQGEDEDTKEANTTTFDPSNEVEGEFKPDAEAKSGAAKYEDVEQNLPKMESLEAKEKGTGDKLQSIQDEFNKTKSMLKSAKEQRDGSELPHAPMREPAKHFSGLKSAISRVAAPAQDGKSVAERLGGMVGRLGRAIKTTLGSFKGGSTAEKAGRAARYGAAKVGQKVGRIARAFGLNETPVNKSGTQNAVLIPVRPFIGLSA